MSRKIVLLVAVALLLVLTVVFSVFIIKAFAAEIKTYNLIIETHRITDAPDEILRECITYRNENIRNLVFVVLIDVFFAFVSSVACYFAFRGEVAKEVSNAARYTYEGYRAHREAKRAERQEKKRQRLQEELERISKGHESEP